MDIAQAAATRAYVAQILGQVLLVTLVAVVLYAFHRVYRRRYLLHWSRAWAALAVYILGATAAVAAVGIGPATHPLRLGISTVSLVAGYLHVVWLLLGTWELATRRDASAGTSRAATAAVVVIAVASVLLFVGDPGAADLRVFVRFGIRSLVGSVAYLAAAVGVLWSAGRRPARFGRRFMGVALVGYALDQLGYFVLTLAPGPGRFSQSFVVGTFDIVAQAAVGIAVVVWLLEDERERLLRAVGEAQRRQKAQACVYRISEAAHSVRDLPELYRSIHASIGEVLPARNLYIALLDRESGTLSFPYFVDERDETPAPKALGRGLTELVLRSRLPLLATPEVFRDLVTRGEVELLYSDSVDWLGVPLLAGGEAIGVLALQTYDPSVRLGPEDRDLLVFVSEQVAAAIAARRTQTALLESETRLRLALEQVPAVLWTTDEHLRFTSSTGAGLAALGLQPNQVVGLSVDEYLGGRATATAANRRALAGESVSYAHRQEGRRFSVRVEPLREAGSGIRGTVGVAIDVTEQEESEARLRQVIDLVPHFIFAKDADGRFVLVNRAVADAYGTTVDALLGKRDSDFARSEAEARHFREDDLEVIRSGRPKVIREEELTDAKGHVRYLQTTKIPFAISGSALPAVLGVSLDITERKAAEEALRRAAKEESLTVLAGGVAHDFNNLLAAMLGHVSLALRKLPPGSPAREHVEKAATAIARAADLTRQMLAYSGRGHFVIQPADLGALVRENLPLLEVALPKNVRLDCHLAPDLPLVDADVGQIQQVLMNLVINGAEAIGERGGSVTVTTGLHVVGAGDDRLGRITGQPLAPGRYVLLEVRDDGPGMDAETLSRIFDPFFSTKFTGRGLGLAAVLGIVKGHRGGLSVESAAGRGTVFRLVFAPSHGASLPPPPPVPAPVRERLRLLLIDDEDIVREMVAEVLEHEGLEVLTAADGEQGIALLRRDAQGIDAVLLDLSMPGLGGEETFARLSALRPELPVILSSGYDRAEATRRFPGRAPAGFIQKPYRPDQLLAEIRRCVRASAP